DLAHGLTTLGASILAEANDLHAPLRSPRPDCRVISVPLRGAPDVEQETADLTSQVTCPNSATVRAAPIQEDPRIVRFPGRRTGIATIKFQGADANVTWDWIAMHNGRASGCIQL